MPGRKSSRKSSPPAKRSGQRAVRKDGVGRWQPEEKKTAGPIRSATKLKIAQACDGSWQLVIPQCARARQEDLEEVEQMIAAGEMEIARDELRWLLSECHVFLAAHKLLGDLALAENDFRLARGHYGYAYQLGIQAFEAAGGAKLLPYRHASNQAFFQAGRGSATCLVKLGKQRLAQEVIARLMQLDPANPLGLRDKR